ncbi:MAG TPA: hypothetical protein VF838_09370 [Trebonia sp.]
MGTSQGSAPGSGQRAILALGYPMLLLLGALQGLIGCFQYSRPPQPLIAILFAVLIFVTCAGCGLGVGTFAAALLPAIGWIAVSFLLASPRPNGSVIITGTAAGEWYLYGGALGCAAGTVTAFFLRVRRSAPPR